MSTLGMTSLGHERRSEVTLAEELQARPGVVPGVRRRVVAFARASGAPARVLADVRLAVSEAVGNAVMHAYEDGDDPRPIRLVATVEDGCLTITVTDDGRGIRSKPSPGQGLGLGLIANSTADFTMERRQPRGTQVRMRFRLEA